MNITDKLPILIDGKIQYQQLDSVQYVSKLYFLKSGEKTWTWSYLINVPDGDSTQSLLDNEKYDKEVELYYVSGMSGSKGYPKTKSPTLIGPTNLGRANYKNSILSAITKANYQLTKKVRSGYKSEEEFGKVISFSNLTLPAPEQFQRKPPSQMNVTKFNPVYIQYKLDGVSLICCYHPSFDEPENVLVYTRNRLKAKGFLNIRKEFKRMFSDCPGLFTVGEVYTHGMQFNDITSVHRKNVYGTEMKCDVDYNIFDCFYTDLDLEKKTFEPNDIIGNYNSLINQLNSNHLTKIDVDKTVELYEEFIPKYSKYIKDMENFSASCSMSNILFTGRQNLLDKLIKPSDIIKKVDTLKATSSKDIEYYYIGAIEEKYEGLILRKDSEYRYSFEKEKRNPN